MAIEPPRVSVPTGWRRVEESVDRPFDVRVVSVTAATRVWEDEATATAIREETGGDRTWRFFFASRLVLRPAPGSSKPLQRLVTARALDGFEDRLRDRGFRSVARRESRNLPVRDRDATLTRFEAVSPVDQLDAVLSVEGDAAVWSAGREFRMAGGAYPVEVRRGTGDAVAAVADALDPEGFRSELLDLIRRVE